MSKTLRNLQRNQSDILLSERRRAAPFMNDQPPQKPTPPEIVMVREGCSGPCNNCNGWCASRILERVLVGFVLISFVVAMLAAKWFVGE